MAELDLLKSLTEEQKEKFKNCKTQEELDKLIAEEGIELSPDQFDAIAGGGCLDCDKECGH